MSTSAADLRAYADTSVSQIKSQETIRTLLRLRGAFGLEITDVWSPNAGLKVRFALPGPDGVGTMMIRVVIPLPDAPTTRPLRGYDEPTDEAWRSKWRDQKERQLWRVLWYWLKTSFEAADAGLLKIEELLLPWIEDSTGRTVGEYILPQLPVLLEKGSAGIKLLPDGKARR